MTGKIVKVLFEVRADAPSYPPNSRYTPEASLDNVIEDMIAGYNAEEITEWVSANVHSATAQ